MQRRLAQLPLHSGKAPAYLFRRMTKLAGAVTMAIVDQFGPDEMLRRLSDPWWFQAFGCVLGFDWHSSGVTTVTCGALKEAAKVYGDDLGLFVAGGKGSTSRQTPREIAETADRCGLSSGDRLIYASRMSAKVDSAAVQDGYQLYHHCLFFTPGGQWCVVQQGMHEAEKSARRYHWLGSTVEDFVCEPHAGIDDLQVPAKRPSVPRQQVFNFVAGEGETNRRSTAELLKESPEWIIAQWKLATGGPTLFAPQHHRVLKSDINPDRLRKLVRTAHEAQPQGFEQLLGTAGVGPAAVRSLALLAEIIFDAPVSHRDPSTAFAPPSEPAPPVPDGRRWADYAYAHGGKDGTPFPVDRETYDRNIELLHDAVKSARLGDQEKLEALRRLRGKPGLS